ncbi:MAG: TorF family putative porin [Rariglobus sp.]
MKKTILAIAALAAGVSASAQIQTTKSSDLAVTLDVTYVSDYVFRGLKNADDSIQPSVEASYGDFYAGAWHSNDINSSSDFSETDFYAGYNLAINETFSADLGVTRYTYSNAAADLDSTEVFAGVKANVVLSPSLYYYYDFDNEVSSYIGSIGHSFPIANVGLNVDVSAIYGFIQRPKGDQGDYSYWGLGAAIPYKLSETATLTAAVNYTHVDRSNFPAGGDQDQDKVVFSVGLAVGF